MRARAPAGLIAALLVCLVRPAAAVECWTGWGYWVDPATRQYKSERLLLATRGPADWLAGRPITLYLLDADEGGFVADQPPLLVTPAAPRFARHQRLSTVTALASVAGHADWLTFGLSHIKQTAFGLPRLDQFYRWACGLSPERGATD